MNRFVPLCFALFLASAQSLATLPCGEDILTSSPRELKAYKITFPRPLSLGDRSVEGSYRFVEQASGHYIDVDGYFGTKDRAGLKKLNYFVERMRMSSPLYDFRLKDVLVSKTTFTLGQTPEWNEDSVEMTGQEIARTLWKDEVGWSSLPFFPPGERSLYALNPTRAEQVDQKLSELSEKYRFETIPLPADATTNDLREYFVAQFSEAMDDLRSLRLVNGREIENPYQMSINYVLTKTARVLKRERSTFSNFKPFKRAKPFDVAAMKTIERQFFLTMRTKIRSSIQELRIALRVDDLMAFQKTIGQAVEEGIFASEVLKLLKEQKVNPDRELDIITASGFYEIKSTAPASLKIRSALRRPNDLLTIHVKQERQAQAQKTLVQLINQQAEGDTESDKESKNVTEINVAEPEESAPQKISRPGVLINSFKRTVVFVDGRFDPSYLSSEYVGIVFPDGSFSRLK